MPEIIPIPLFLQSGKAQELNSKLISNIKSFAFLGEPKDFINKKPSTYAEAFDLYISGLYVLYHDCGMFFLQSFTNPAIILRNNPSFFNHIRFVYNSRSVLQHSDDYKTADFVYSSLKNYYFKNYIPFKYNDWHEFWLKADENHWKWLVEKIVDDSDTIYTDYMMKIAEQDTPFQPIAESISNIFSTGKYCDIKKNCVNIYDRSLDKRFLNNISNKLKHSFVWSDINKAEQELERFKNQEACSKEELQINGELTPQAIKSEAIEAMKKYLLSGDCKNSDSLFQLLCQTIYDLIQSRVDAEINSDIDELLD